MAKLGCDYILKYSFTVGLLPIVYQNIVPILGWSR